MTTRLKRLDFNREKQILINLILNDDYCKAVIPTVKSEYFRSKAAATILKWIIKYYKSYGTAPKTHIQEIYKKSKKKLDSTVHEQIGVTLQYLSDIADTKVHNIQFLIDTADSFFKERHFELQKEALEVALEDGNLIEAEKILNTPYKGIKESTRKFFKFNDADLIRKCVRSMVRKIEDSDAFFKFPGRIGDFLGVLERRWFVVYIAPAKRGKTTYMLDSAVTAVTRRLNTIVLSLEMPEDQLMQRYALSITGAKPEEKKRQHFIPLMDCVHNQDGSCSKPECPSLETLSTDNSTFPTYEDFPDWERCTACRGTHDFKPTSWKEPVTKKYISEGKYLKKIEKFNRLFGKYGRIIHIPSKTATVSELRALVKSLQDTENFIADVIVLDYADLIKPERASNQKRHDLDDIWEGLRSWAQEEHFLLISASQTNRLSASAEYLKDTHIAEDYSKIAKVDLAIGLCQTDEMKRKGIMNINKVVHRHESYIQSHVCTVLQDIHYQQSVLDSEFLIL